jgi:hypothetical protein
MPPAFIRIPVRNACGASMLVLTTPFPLWIKSWLSIRANATAAGYVSACVPTAPRNSTTRNRTPIFADGRGNYTFFDNLVKSLEMLFGVTPAKAGIQSFQKAKILWTPAFAGVTIF